MAVLTEAEKEQIVLQLAYRKRPAEVVAFMAAEFEIELTVQQVRTYDPTNPRFEADRDKWEPIFVSARKGYDEDVATVPIANQGFRLRQLQEGLEIAKKAKNWKLVAELLEQAAKEVGGILTNERKLSVDHGKARDMTPEDRAAKLGSIIAEALDKRREQQPTTH